MLELFSGQSLQVGLELRRRIFYDGPARTADEILRLREQRVLLFLEGPRKQIL